MRTRYYRLARLIEMIHIVSNDPTWTAKKFAGYFEVSEKRIYDDLNELNTAKIPIVFDENKGGYTFLKNPKIPTAFILEGMKNPKIVYGVSVN